MSDIKFDVTLSMDDPNFIDLLANALGIDKGDDIEIMTPQFERTDGREIKYFPKTMREFEAIKNLPEDELKKIGCQVWDREKGEVHWLFPKEWYTCIPNGLSIVDINGVAESFKQGVTDDDIRFGALPYGFIQKGN